MVETHLRTVDARKRMAAAIDLNMRDDTVTASTKRLMAAAQSELQVDPEQVTSPLIGDPPGWHDNKRLRDAIVSAQWALYRFPGTRHTNLLVTCMARKHVFGPKPVSMIQNYDTFNLEHWHSYFPDAPKGNGYRRK